MSESDRPVAIVTGASSGIGAATALEFARKRYAVCLLARREERLREVADRCRNEGAAASVYPCDVTDADAVEQVVRQIVEEYGRVDVLVNNAGMGHHGRVHEISDEDMNDILDVNVLGVLHCLRSVAPVMMSRRSGHVFNVSSVIGKRGTPFNGAYCATKFAVVGLTDSMRVEMMPYKVRVTCVCPGLTDTEFFEKVDGTSGGVKESSFKTVRTMQSPEVVARKIVRTVGRNKPELVFTAGGKLLVWLAPRFPRLVDWMMKKYHDDIVKRERRD
ncbi:MAG: SDR family oxidoreductase [Phycisphaerae bacterium]